jgi:hypothetical protein
MSKSAETDESAMRVSDDFAMKKSGTSVPQSTLNALRFYLL